MALAPAWTKPLGVVARAAVEIVLADAESLDFRTQAACAGSDPRSWYPGRGEALDVLRRLCEGCPVVVDCLAWSLRHERYGVWGGVGEAGRQRIRRTYGIATDTEFL